jgi:hypothetical protein
MARETQSCARRPLLFEFQLRLSIACLGKSSFFHRHRIVGKQNNTGVVCPHLRLVWWCLIVSETVLTRSVGGCCRSESADDRSCSSCSCCAGACSGSVCFCLSWAAGREFCCECCCRSWLRLSNVVRAALCGEGDGGGEGSSGSSRLWRRASLADRERERSCEVTLGGATTIGLCTTSACCRRCCCCCACCACCCCACACCTRTSCKSGRAGELGRPQRAPPLPTEVFDVTVRSVCVTASSPSSPFEEAAAAGVRGSWPRGLNTALGDSGARFLVCGGGGGPIIVIPAQERRKENQCTKCNTWKKYDAAPGWMVGCSAPLLESLPPEEGTATADGAERCGDMSTIAGG